MEGIDFNKKESNKEELKIPDIFSLDDTEIYSLRNSVAKSNGKIRIFVHPIYSLYNGSKTTTYIEPSRGFEEQSKFAIDGFKKVVFSQSEKSVPIFIFEEGEKVETIKKFLNLHKRQIHTQVIIIPTKLDDPTPVTPWNLEDQKSFAFINKIFHSLGVKEVLIGGMNLSVRTPEEVRDSGLLADQCVAKVAENLDFPYKISNFSHPNDSKDIEKARESMIK